MSTREWGLHPECPLCGGPVEPADPDLAGGANLVCARCDYMWIGSGVDVADAREAASRWRAAHPDLSLRDFERQRAAEHRAKYARAMRGEW